MRETRSGTAGSTEADGDQMDATLPAARVERVYIEREHRVRTFLGDRDEDKVLSFEADVRRAWRRLPVNDKEACRDVILDHIGPAVRLELGCLDPSKQDDPEELLRLIVSTYGESRSPHQLLRVLLDANQQPGEDVRSFSQRLKANFDKLVRRQAQLGLAEEEDSTLRDQFVLGTRDVELRRILRERVREKGDVTFRMLREAAVAYADDTIGVTTAAAVSASSELLDAIKLLTTQNQRMQQRLESLEEKLAQMSSSQGQQSPQQPLSPPPRPAHRPLQHPGNGSNQW